MIINLDLSNKETAKKLLDIQIPSYLVEADIIGFDGIPQLQDTEEKLMQSNEKFLGYVLNDRLVASISFIEDQSKVDICRLVVHPNYFRKGIARTLVEYIINSIAINKPIIVTTGAKNTPAKNLYFQLGFQEVKNIEVAPNFYITLMEHNTN
ncbi:GNAT family N-acetyltransferase [Cytobacillus pseudoceanisediminis]|uniref:GNAT family N-acetyltransferase n=1 Tax=Cytobacillus pseudoceanisediminis TaxID=3051614 RepID=UPI003C2DCFB0